jgi:hypothetical protein
MVYLRRIIPIFSVCISCLLTVSCTENKYSQCEKIFAIANGVADRTKSLTDGGKTKDIKAFLQAADVMEQASQNLANLELKDPKLIEYQTGFINMYRDYAQATRDIVRARNDRDISAARAAQEKVQQAGKSERELGDGINSYCKGN